jgi:hypothetical protein
MINNQTKVCSICNEEKSLDQFYSYEKVNKNGEKYIYYQPYCKPCTVEKTRKNRNREEFNAKMREYCREYIKRPGAMERHRKVMKNVREQGKQRDWQRKNKDKIREYNKKRNNKNHKISDNEWENCKKYFNHRCDYCGLAIENHYIIFRGNQQLGDFHKDHVDDEGTNDLSNCVPACKVCNTSKHNHTLEEWYNNDNPVFNEERLEKIHKWLDEDYKKYIKINN